MGLTVLEIEVGNPADPEVTERVEFLIDSGAIYSVVPTPVLQKLGIKPLAEEEFRLANGTKVVREKSIASSGMANGWVGLMSFSAKRAIINSWAPSLLGRSASPSIH